MASNATSEAILGARTAPLGFGTLKLTIDRLADNEEAITEACRLDLGKPTYETYLTELGWLKNDIIFICDNLAQWSKDEKAPDIDLVNSFMSPVIRKDPLGTVLVIGYVKLIPNPIRII
jgi:acyl-CoA reductase-like NAD-dependent aldehyde dehydrogenase